MSQCCISENNDKAESRSASTQSAPPPVTYTLFGSVKGAASNCCLSLPSLKSLPAYCELLGDDDCVVGTILRG